MSPRERLLATIRGEKTDRVPLGIWECTRNTRKEAKAIEDPAAREIALRVFDQVAGNVTWPSTVNRYMVTPPQFMHVVNRQQDGEKVTVTTEIRTPKGPLTAVTEQNTQTQTTWTVKYPVESLADIGRMRSLVWALPVGLKAPGPDAPPDNLREKCILLTRVSSPVICAAGMMSYQYFLELCATELGLLKELTAECTRRVLSVLDVLLAPGLIECVWIGGCEWLTPPMGSPRLYEELVQQPERQIIDRARRAGAFAHVHCHGKVHSTMALAIARGTDFFEPVEPPPDGDITFADAKDLAAGRMTLAGNVEARVLANGTVEEVDQATRAAFEGGKRHMVLYHTAGPIARMTPKLLRNYHRMIDVWEELSPM